MNMIEIQDAFITRLRIAHAKITPRTKGNRFTRTRRAARKQAKSRLMRLGYSETAAVQIVTDAYDVFKLEINAHDEED